MNQILKYKNPEFHFKNLEALIRTKNLNIPKTYEKHLLYFHTAEKTTQSTVDYFFKNFQHIKFITVVTFSYQSYEMFYVKVKQNHRLRGKTRIIHIRPAIYETLARIFLKNSLVLSDNQQLVEPLVKLKQQLSRSRKKLLQKKSSKKSNKKTKLETKKPDKPIYMLCPSFGKACGIAEYSEEILRGSYGHDIWGITHTSQVFNPEANVIIHHEFALFNPVHGLATESDEILINFLKAHQGKIYIAFHTVPNVQLLKQFDSKALMLFKTVEEKDNIHVIVFNYSMMRNLNSIIKIDESRIHLLDLGLPILEYPDVKRADYDRKTIAIIGFNAGGKDKVINSILKKTNYNLLLIGRGYDEYIGNSRIKLYRDFLPNREFDQTILSEAVIGLSHRESTGYSSSASFRRLLALGIPSVAADVPEHNHIKVIHKSMKDFPFYKTENEMIEQINRLLSDSTYYAFQRKLLSEISEETTIKQWEPIIEQASS